MNDTWDPQLYQNAHSFVWERSSDLVELLDPKPGERILDAGCGTGQLTARIAEVGALTVGIDSSEKMIEAARANYPELCFLVGDIRHFKTDEPFDALFSNAALHWVEPAENAVRSIAGALKLGGRFIAEFGGRHNVGGILAAVQSVFPLVRNPWYFPSIAEYAALLESEGLEVTHAFHFPRITPLEEGTDGFRNWLFMFGRAFADSVSMEEIESAIPRIEDSARTKLFFENRWHADYYRIRVRAIKRV